MKQAKAFLGEEELNLKSIDWEKDIPLITVGTGCGKTYFATHELPTIVERESGRDVRNVLMLVPTSIIKEQTKNDYEDVTTWFDSFDLLGGFADDGRIKVGCFASLVNYLNDGNQIECKPDLVIIDEADLIVKWAVCFEGYARALDWLLSNTANTMVCGLTATPRLLLHELNDKLGAMRFKEVTARRTRYETANTVVYKNSSMYTFLKTIEPRNDKKYLVYVRSAKACLDMCRKTKNSAFLVSKANETVDKKTGKLISEIMQEQEYSGEKLIDYIVNWQRLPKEVNVLFFNDAYFCGMNIKDKNIKTIACESCDLATVHQVRGRLRGYLENLAVIYNFGEEQAAKEKRKQFLMACKCFDSLDDGTRRMMYACEKTRVDDGGDVRIYIDDCGNVATNVYASAVYEYQKQMYLSLRIDPQLYFETLPGEKSFVDGRVFQTIAANNAASRNFNGLKWLDRKLFKDDKKQLANEIALLDKSRHKASWTTAKRWLIAHGYEVRDSKTYVDGKQIRYAIISIR